MMRGRFITFEGPEGSGKTTQSTILAESLRAKGIDVLHTREPGGTPTGEIIRDILQNDAASDDLCDRAELLLFLASRAQLVECVLNPHLEQGGWVICDRFIDSTVAYQGYARGGDVSAINRLNAYAIHETMPDLTIMVDISLDQGFDRVRRRTKEGELDRIEREDSSFHEAVRNGYLELAEQHPERIVLVDGSHERDMIAARIGEIINERFPG